MCVMCSCIRHSCDLSFLMVISLTIDVINVRKKIKNVKNAFFISKIKKVFVNVIKTLPSLYILLV